MPSSASCPPNGQLKRGDVRAFGFNVTAGTTVALFKMPADVAVADS